LTDKLAQTDFETLRRISTHLETLSSEMMILEDVVARFRPYADAEDTKEHIVTLQRVDFISQSLRDLAQLTLALSVHTDARDAEFAKVKLESTRALFGCEQDIAKNQSGEADLF
jgi:hypothetical protein